MLIELGQAQEGTQPSHPHWVAGGGADEHATAADMQRFYSTWPCELAGAHGTVSHVPCRSALRGSRPALLGPCSSPPARHRSRNVEGKVQARAAGSRVAGCSDRAWDAWERARVLRSWQQHTQGASCMGGGAAFHQGSWHEPGADQAARNGLGGGDYGARCAYQGGGQLPQLSAGTGFAPEGAGPRAPSAPARLWRALRTRLGFGQARRARSASPARPAWRSPPSERGYGSDGEADEWDPADGADYKVPVNASWFLCPS